MSNEINKVKEIMDRLKRENTIKASSQEESLKALEEINNETKEAKEEYKLKEANSRIKVSQIIFK